MQPALLPNISGLFALSQIDFRHTIPNCRYEPSFHEPTGTWLYGNQKLLGWKLAHVSPYLWRAPATDEVLREIEREAQEIVLSGSVIVTGIHNEAHQRAAILPLRWGAPRIVVFSGGFYHHLGHELNQEPFRTARLWRYEWDASCDLAISLRAPDKLPTCSKRNPTVDRLIESIAGS